MNKKTLAIEISKHPLIKKLLESKLATSSEIARLVVEELIGEVENSRIRAAKANLTTALKTAAQNGTVAAFIKKVEEKEKPFYPKFDSDEFDEDDRETYLKHVEILLQRARESIKQQAQQSQKPEETEQPKSLPSQQLKVDYQRIADQYNNYEFIQNLEESDKIIVFKFMAALKDKGLFENLNTNPLVDKSGIVKVLRDLKAGNPKEMEKLLMFLNEEEIARLDEIFRAENNAGVLKFLNMLKRAPLERSPAQDEKTTEPTTEPETQEPQEPSEEQPEDEAEIDTTKISALRDAAQSFREEFFQQRFLVDQGKIVKALIRALQAVLQKEDRAAAITNESTLNEEEEVQVEERDIRNIKIAFRLLLQNIREAKSRLTLFKKAAGEGKIVSADYKRDLIETIQEIQDFIHQLTVEINGLLPKKGLNEQQEEEKEKAPFQDVVDVHKSVSALLSNILAADSDGELSRDLSTNIEKILDSLQSITYHFPSVNPFKTKNVDFDSMVDEFDKAVKDVKPALFAVVDTVKTKSAQDIVLKKVIRKMKEFSQSIQNIFDIKSEFVEIAKKASEEQEAVETEETEEVEFKIEDLLGLLEKNKAVYDKALKYIKESEKIEEDRKDSLRIVDRELSGQAGDLESLMDLGSDLGSDPKIKQTILIAAKKFVELYDNIRVTYNTLKDKELGTKTQSKLDNIFKKAETELDVLEKQLQGVINSAEPQDLNTKARIEVMKAKLTAADADRARKQHEIVNQILQDRFFAAQVKAGEKTEADVENAVEQAVDDQEKNDDQSAKEIAKKVVQSSEKAVAKVKEEEPELEQEEMLEKAVDIATETISMEELEELTRLSREEPEDEDSEPLNQTLEDLLNQVDKENKQETENVIGMLMDDDDDEEDTTYSIKPNEENGLTKNMAKGFMKIVNEWLPKTMKLAPTKDLEVYTPKEITRSVEQLSTTDYNDGQKRTTAYDAVVLPMLDRIVKALGEKSIQGEDVAGEFLKKIAMNPNIGDYAVVLPLPDGQRKDYMSIQDTMPLGNRDGKLKDKVAYATTVGLKQGNQLVREPQVIVFK